MFATKVMLPQKQLDQTYQNKKYVKKRLMTTIVIPSIQIPLLDSTPRTVPQLANCIANRLSEKPKTAGSAYKGSESSPFQSQTDDAMCMLDVYYGGAVRRSVKALGNRGLRQT